MAVLSMLLAACQKDDTNTNKSVEKIKVTANLSQGETTKVDVDSDGLGVYWTNADLVSVFGQLKDGNNLLGQLTTAITKKSKKALFEGVVDEAVDGKYYVFYPNEMNDGTSINLDLSNLQCENSDDNTYLSNYMYMVSKEPGYLDGDNKMKFTMEHLTALLQFNVGVRSSGRFQLLSVNVTGKNINNNCKYNVYDKTGNYNQGDIRLLFLQPMDLYMGLRTFLMPVLPAEAGSVTVYFEVINVETGEVRMLDNTSDIEGFKVGMRHTKTIQLAI